MREHWLPPRGTARRPAPRPTPGAASMRRTCCATCSSGRGRSTPAFLTLGPDPPNPHLSADPIGPYTRSSAVPVRHVLVKMPCSCETDRLAQGLDHLTGFCWPWAMLATHRLPSTRRPVALWRAQSLQIRCSCARLPRGERVAVCSQKVQPLRGESGPYLPSVLAGAVLPRWMPGLQPWTRAG